jgi:hypothetical protein
MIPLWRRAPSVQDDTLPEWDRYLLGEGWVTGPVGALLIKAKFKPGWGSDWPAEEVAQHEYEINDIHISQDGVPADRDTFLAAMTARARHFAYRAIEGAQGMTGAGALVAVISVGLSEDYLMHGTTVKFFTQRGQYPAYFSDLERFKLEAMAVIEPGDELGAGPASPELQP